MTSLTRVGQFADKRNLRVSTDKNDNTSIINGRHGHLYEYDDDRLAVIFMGASTGTANNRRKACIAAGMEITQDGDWEFAASFNPEDRKQASLAIKVARVKTKRVLSPEQRKRATEALKAYRDGSAVPKAA